MSHALNLLFLRKTLAPAAIHRAYLKSYADKKTGRLKKYGAPKNDFAKNCEKLKLTNDWFMSKIPYWLSSFEKCGFTDKPFKALEIGSWEGLSSYYLLRTFPHAQITCVDTWEGGDEHKGQEVLSKIEKNFDSNLKEFENRVSKYKGTSLAFFNAHPNQEQFDFVYIDGSHHCDDVVIDAFRGFRALKVGGLMIFDDYTWKYYKKANDNPAAAINAFLRVKEGAYKIIHVYSQLVIQKTASA